MEENQQIEIIQKQTDLTKDEIITLLEKFENDTEKVIRYYLSDGKKTDEYTYPISTDNQSQNQKVFTEIREFMDTISYQYNKYKQSQTNNTQS